MAHEDIPTTEPTELRAGISWRWDRTLSDHPPSDNWTLKYALRGATDQDFTASTNDDTYEIRVDPSITEAITPGTYTLVGYVEKGSPVTDREPIYEGTLHVRADPTDAVGTETHAEKMYDSITAVLEGRATTDQEEVRINGREVTKIPIQELLRLRNVYADQIRMERHPGELSPGVEAKFGAA